MEDVLGNEPLLVACDTAADRRAVVEPLELANLLVGDPGAGVQPEPARGLIYEEVEERLASQVVHHLPAELVDLRLRVLDGEQLTGRAGQQPQPRLALAHRLLGACLRHRHRQIPGKPLPAGDGLRREHPLAPIVQLEQAQPLLADTQRQQGDRFVALAVAAVAGACLAILVRGGREKPRGAVRPEAAARSEERLLGIGAPADHVPAHALDHRVAGAVAP